MAGESGACGWISEMHQRFRRTVSCFEEKDAGFAPKPGMYSVAGQIAHVAHTVEWFVGPAFEGKPFDLDFEGMARQAMAVTKLSEALAWLDRAFEDLQRRVAKLPVGDLSKPAVPVDAAIMPGASYAAVLSGIEDHTAHHRGSLAVYARLLGKEPAMPYM